MPQCSSSASRPPVPQRNATCAARSLPLPRRVRSVLIFFQTTQDALLQKKSSKIQQLCIGGAYTSVMSHPSRHIIPNQRRLALGDRRRSGLVHFVKQTPLAVAARPPDRTSLVLWLSLCVTVRRKNRGPPRASQPRGAPTSRCHIPNPPPPGVLTQPHKPRHKCRQHARRTDYRAAGNVSAVLMTRR